MEGGRRCRGAYVLWTEPSGSVPACCHLRRQDPEGRQTRRSSRRAADQIRSGHQHEDRESAGPDDPAVTLGWGGSAHRVMDRRGVIGNLVRVLAVNCTLRAPKRPKSRALGGGLSDRFHWGALGGVAPHTSLITL